MCGGLNEKLCKKRRLNVEKAAEEFLKKISSYLSEGEHEAIQNLLNRKQYHRHNYSSKTTKNQMIKETTQQD